MAPVCSCCAGLLAMTFISNLVVLERRGETALCGAGRMRVPINNSIRPAAKCRFGGMARASCSVGTMAAHALEHLIKSGGWGGCERAKGVRLNATRPGQLRTR